MQPLLKLKWPELGLNESRPSEILKNETFRRLRVLLGRAPGNKPPPPPDAHADPKRRISNRPETEIEGGELVAFGGL